MTQVTYITTKTSVIFTATIRKKSYSIETTLEEGLLYINDNTLNSLVSRIQWENNVGNIQGKVNNSIDSNKSFKMKYNRNTAEKVANEAGYNNLQFKAQSYSNGASFYFGTTDGREIRVSDHSVTSTQRIQSGTIFLSFTLNKL
jgi:hypothetical protein